VSGALTQRRVGSAAMLRFVAKLNPHGRMIATLRPAANRDVDLRVYQAIGKRRAQQQMVDAQTGVPAKGVPKKIPEGIDSFARMEGAECIGPALFEESEIRRPRLWCEQRIIEPALGFVDQTTEQIM
jgi:hypothetical protein